VPLRPAHLPDAVVRLSPDGLKEVDRDADEAPGLLDPVRAQAVFVGGNGFRSVGVIAALEEELARPVLTANQVLLWGMLRAIRSRVSLQGYGRLFTVPASA